jgi:hypothetical protein
MYCPKEKREIPALKRGTGEPGPLQARHLSSSTRRVERNFGKMAAKRSSRIQKKDIAEELAQRMNTSNETAEEWMDTVFEILYESFKKGRSVTLQGFGSFYIQPRGKTTVFKFNPGQRFRHLFGWSSTHKGD